VQYSSIELLWRDGIIDLPMEHSTRQLGWRFRYVGQGVVMRVAWVSTCTCTVCLLVDMYWCADYMAVMIDGAHLVILLIRQRHHAAVIGNYT
jgi:hypothetical protein